MTLTRLIRKLGSERGASFVMGLVLFLICATVAAIIVMAASVNAGHSARTQAQQQSYLTLSSAARLLDDDMVEQQPIYAVTVVTKTYGCTHTHDDAGVQSNTGSLTRTGGAALTSTPLMGVLEEGVKSISGGASSYTKDIVISYDGLDDVDATFIMGSNYSITIIFETEQNATYRYSMQLTAPATLTTGSAQTEVLTAACTHADEWVWDDPNYQFYPDATVGNTKYGHYESVTYDGTLTTQATSVSWGTPTLSKGEVL